MNEELRHQCLRLAVQIAGPKPEYEMELILSIAAKLWRFVESGEYGLLVTDGSKK